MEASRIFKPWDWSGDFLWRNYSAHDERKADVAKLSQGKHELAKLNGLRSLIPTHLARRGGHRSNKKVAISDIDRHSSHEATVEC